MKIIVLTVAVLILFTYHTYAQKDKWSVKAGEDVNEALTDSVRFHYRQFISGYVYFRDGKISGAPLNLNLINGDMQFIGPKGDTLSIANEATINFITVDKDTFFYDNKAFLELVAGAPSVKLAKREALRISDIKKTGAFDVSSSTSSIATYSSIQTNNRSTQLTERKELVIVKETTYYIGDTYNHFLHANKKNLIKMYGRKQNEIEMYLRDNKVRFNNEEDLKNLIAFLKTN